MDADRISYWAKRSPDSIAVILPRGAVRYAVFEQQINKVAQRLLAENVGSRQRVAVHVTDEYVHWLLLLALSRLGVASASIGRASPNNPFVAVLKPDLVLSNAEITGGWLDEAMRLPDSPLPVRRASPDEVVRYFSSSGTTGTPKVMAFTRALVSLRADMKGSEMGFGAGSRLCMLIGPGTALGYTFALGCWMTGGTVVHNSMLQPSLAEWLGRVQPTDLVSGVGTLGELVRAAPAQQGAKPPLLPSTEIHITGSALPRALADEVRRVLGPHIFMNYGAAEAGGIAVGPLALAREDGATVGYLHPGVEVEALDDQGRPVPAGVTGVLRIRTLDMARGYLNERPDEKAASTLRDGWFYPGDLGSLSPDGLLVVHGRGSELLNIGGNKFSPQAIEEVALSCAGIRDAAVFAVPDAVGVDAPWIAVVRGDDHKPGELLAKVTARWPLLNDLKVAVVPAIPRNPAGKIERLRLREQAVAWASQPQAKRAT